jgi:two-component system, OmpR family, response regulator RegX3
VKIAFVEDDPIQRKAVTAWIEEAGHRSIGFDTCESYLQQVHNNASFDLLLLDWGMPDLSGLELLRMLRGELGQTLPIMFLTCRDDESDIVTALKNGADDYLVKPPRRMELLARVDALSRRRSPRPRNKTAKLRFGPFELDTHSRQLRRNNELLTLTQKEFSLAHYLLTNLGQIITRQELLEKVWRQSANINTRTVDTHISRLRKKLELIPEHGWQLTAVYQYGYRLDWLELAQELA